MRSPDRRAVLSGILSGAGLLALPTPLRAAPYSITDSRGPQEFAARPERIICLNWALAEQVLDLGVTPLGIADPEGYAAWVGKPELPESVVDVGKREAPNLERILSLRPDLILLSGEQSAFIHRFRPIAPVLHFKQFSEDHGNAATAREIYRKLGNLLGRSDVAEEKLARMDARLAELGGEIAAAYPDGVPKVTVIRFIDDKRVVIYGRNGMPEAALQGLGLTSAVEIENSRWGLAFKPVTALAEIDRGLVLHIEPFAKRDLLFGTELWQDMPFVKAGRFHGTPPLWTYGGALSIGRIGEEIASVLLSAKQQ